MDGHASRRNENLFMVRMLACQCYIELNPMRAGMVAHPANYPLVELPCQCPG
ncbi:hypothetical protein THIOM_005099 [Candidatus Thiomargarita nelsonii]|uniref:Transposase n=1 Tax=Candidatus Thiomargarita nelsonii TaxID=1003181 RepID=A0A176RU57_9GAMM|nr:hypothetical protein THIOM_005099 [Candidatus Thiomargarita nelsonii]